MTTGSDGALWFTNESSIGRITTDGTITTYPTPHVNQLWGIAAGPDGAVWFTDHLNNSIGRITTAATPEISGFSPTGGRTGTAVTLNGFNLKHATTVAFDGTVATIVSKAATQIVTYVPTGARTGLITVTTPKGIATSKWSPRDLGIPPTAVSAGQQPFRCSGARWIRTIDLILIRDAL